MSSFVVKDRTINRVIGFLAMDRESASIRWVIDRETGADLLTPAGQEALGRAMFDLNCNAVEQRYGPGQAKEFRDLDYCYRYELADQIQAYRSLACWRYQCIEGDIPESSLLYATMERVQGMLAHQIVAGLPEYDQAERD